jgi:glyoxylase-like metal-dependent hydrolase (beta-lactamase superfamily II)
MEIQRMQETIKTFRLSMPLGMGHVNCYLIDTGSGQILIDTGGSNRRKELEMELVRAGCGPGQLRLIILTHGDFDHIGNAEYLRTTLGGKIAMHHYDLAMAELGDMFVNRKKPNVLIRMLLPIFSGFGKAERFTPDILLEDGDDLLEFSFDSKVFTLPGHSKGSIGVLTASCDLFCGDLFENTKEPVLNPLTDDLGAAKASIQKLENMGVGTVYPGHGDPFPFELLKKEIT